MSDKKPTLLVIDGHSLAFRAFFALPVDNFSTKDGQHTNAIHGFLSMLLLLLQNEKPSHMAIAFDKSRASFRTREYPEYKGTRNETPQEFKGQIPLLQQVLTAMGIRVIEIDDFEADDILATLAARGQDEGYEVLLVSGDRDSIQLVNDDVTLLYPNALGVSQLKRYDPSAVIERYGVRPEQYPDIAALVGESSDNLIGITKVGEKTAVKWVTQYGNLEGVLAHADEITGVVGQNLRNEKENAVRNRRLNALVRDVALDLKLDDLKARAIDLDVVAPIFDRLEFRTLMERIRKLSAEGKLNAHGAAGVAVTGSPVPAGTSRNAQGNEEIADGDFAHTAVALPRATPPAMRQLTGSALNEWLQAAQASEPAGIGLHFETLDGKVIGVGLATATETVQFSWEPANLDLKTFEIWLASDAPKILNEAKPQIKALSRVGLSLNGLVLDTLVTAGLVNPNQPPRDLSELVEQYLLETLPEPDPSMLVPTDDSVVGSAELAWYTLRLAPKVLSALPPVSRTLLAEIEMPLIAVLARMELQGVPVDRAQLSSFGSQLSEKIQNIAQQAYAIIGKEINLGSPKQLQEVLFDDLGMPKTRRTKTGYTTDAAALIDLQETNPHPFLDLLLEHRDATKLNQMVETLERAIAADGKVHTTYGQVGAATGRMSSNDPNLQNIPIRTEEGRRIRAAFTAGVGTELLTADYSQIEMRIMAHLSEDPGLIEAFKSGEDLHRFVGARVFNVPPSDVTNAMRTKVKAMSYGLAYGLSAFGLSKQLRIPQSEAKSLMSEYFQRFGGVRDYLRGVVEQAKIDGFTETIFGRRRPFPDLMSPNRIYRENAERAALNSPIQGSAADLIKRAMVNIDSDLIEKGLKSRMLMQVHDELVFEVASGEREVLETLVRARMAQAADLSVPLEVHIGSGVNWDAAAH